MYFTQSEPARQSRMIAENTRSLDSSPSQWHGAITQNEERMALRHLY